MSKAPNTLVKKITSLTQAIDAFSTHNVAHPGLKCYRGQKVDTWKNVAGIFRPDMTNLAVNERKAFRDLISVHPQEFEHDESMFDKLVRMQHYGLPTRLLDVTMNALIALYFATEKTDAGTEDGLVLSFLIPEGREKYFDSDSVSCIANLVNMTEDEKKAITKLRVKIWKTISAADPKGRIDAFNNSDVIKRLHHFIKSEKTYFQPIINSIDLFKPYFVHPKMSNRRIVAQTGAFIIYGIEPPVEITFRHPISPSRFAIKCNAKYAIRRELESLGITESTLFPEIDKAATRIKNFYTS